MSPDPKIQKFLGSIEPFKSLSPADLRNLASNARQKVFEKEEMVYNEGDPADYVWILYEGRVRIFKYTSEGRPFAIESLAAGELFGTLCRLGGNKRTYPCTAIAAERSIVLQILDRVFIEHYTKSPGMLYGVCSLCSDRLKDVQELRCMGQESVHVKLANILARLYQVHGATIPFTKKEISELIGVAIETTFRALSDLQKKGILESERGKILVKKPEDLRSIVDQA